MRLLIVDDAPDIATLLKLAFQLDGYAVDTAGGCADAAALADVNEYDALILDLGLPDGDGLELCRRLRAEHPRLLIIILSAQAGAAAVVAGLDAGADDYLPKPFDYAELTARVRALLRRDMRVRQPVLRCGPLSLDPAAGRASLDGRRLALPRKQLRILEFLMRRPGELVSQEALLEHVWDAEANPFTNTVRVHINALRRALGDSAARPRFIETVVGQGYRLIADAVTETLSPPHYAAPVSGESTSAGENEMSETTGGASLRLLIVDDAAEIAQLLVVHFHGAGHTTFVAHDGRSALDLFARERPDMVILDLGLPDMDGLEVCRQIRAASAAPVIMLTRRSRGPEVAAGMAAGASAYITKPFDVAELDAAIGRLRGAG